ncbi:MAG: DUF5711 family protein [Oscillospiraceae bacterium]|jgi:hypothetical protein|nr:DUF5711 family protein [Oscillospiraceae bacterium]
MVKKQSPSARSRLPGELPPIGDTEHREKTRRRRQARRAGKPPRGIYTAIAVLLTCAVAMVVWVNRENLKPANLSEWVQTQMLGLATGDGYPLKLGSENVKPRNFISSGKNVFLTSDTAVQAYNGSAKQLFSRKHSFAEPMMKVSENRVLIYNLSGTGYQLESPLRTLVNGTADGKLMGGDVCANGRYALLTQQDGYCGKLTVYLPDGQVAYSYSFSEYYPTAVALNSSGTRAVVTASNTKDGELTGVVYELNFSSKTSVKPLAQFDNTFFIDVSYTEQGGILAVGDTQTTALSASGKVLHTYSYGDGELSTWELSKNMAVLGLSSFHNAADSTLAAVSAEGKLLGSVQVKGNISSVSGYGDTTMAALCNKQVLAFTSGGHAAGSCSADSNARAIALRSGREVYVLEVSEVELQKLS